MGSDKAREREIEKVRVVVICLLKGYIFRFTQTSTLHIDIVNALDALDSPSTPMSGRSPPPATKIHISPAQRSTSLNQNLSYASSSAAYPRQKINSIYDINGKKRTQYVYSGTTPRPRASSRSKHGSVPYAQSHSLISPIQEGRF